MIYKHEEFSIDMDLDIVTVHALSICEKINCHAELNLAGICSEVNDIPGKKQIQVNNKLGKTIFCGKIYQIELNKEGDLLCFQLRAYSYSQELEQVSRKRAFQGSDMTYRKVMDEVFQSYPSADYIDKASDRINIPHSFIQFEETDWHFLKRLASHFNTGICVDCNAYSIRLYFGIHSEDATELDGEILSRRIDLLSTEQLIEVRMRKQYQIGTQISYEKKIYLIESLETFLEKAELIYRLRLVRAENVSFPYISNQHIAGTHIWAFAKEVHRNKLRIQYQIEDYAQGNIPFLPFAAEVNNKLGYYMPEPGDEVEVTFPDSEEEHAFVSAARRGADKADTAKDSIMYMKNKEGLGFYMDKEKLRFSAGMDNSAIVMYQDETIRIEAPESISIRAAADIEMGGRTGMVTIKAENGITFQGGTTESGNIMFDTSGDIICKAAKKVVIRGSDMISGAGMKPSSPSIADAHEVRNEALALSGIEFLSQSVTENVDFQGAQKIMNGLLGRKENKGEKTEHSDGNLMKEKLFQNDERLFNSFSYGESKKG